VKANAKSFGLPSVVPHDLRRTSARLCHQAGGKLDQIHIPPVERGCFEASRRGLELHSNSMLMKTASRLEFTHVKIAPGKRPDGQETQEWLTLLPRLEGGRRDGTHSPIEAEAGS